MDLLRRARLAAQDTFFSEPDEDYSSSSTDGRPRGLVFARAPTTRSAIETVVADGAPFGAPPPPVEQPAPAPAATTIVVEMRPLPSSKATAVRPPAPVAQLRAATERERTMMWLQSRVNVVRDGWFIIGFIFLVLAGLTWKHLTVVIRAF